MDDYILKVLSRQAARQEGAPETVWEKQRYISQETGADSLRGGTAEKNGEAAERRAKREEALWSMLRAMEPLTVTSREETGEGAGRGESGGYISPNLSRLSGIVFGRNSRQLTPEGLSMFYQRDARRFS